MKHFLSVSFILITVISSGQEVHRYSEITRKADSLYKLKDYRSAARNYSYAVKMLGENADNIYEYKAASSWSQANDTDSAFLFLQKLADRGYTDHFSISIDFNFLPLHSDSRWKSVSEKIANNKILADTSAKEDCRIDTKSIRTSIIKPVITYYSLKTDIEVKSRKLKVEGYATIDFHGQKEIALILWKNTTIHEISCGGIQLEYSFDTTSVSPISYIPGGRNLVLINPGGPEEVRNIYFNYICDLGTLSGWAKSFNDNWIELNFYSAWYPVNVDSRDIRSEIEISIDKPYKISGSGIIKMKDDKWIMNHKWPVFDNVVVASADLKTVTIKEGGAVIEVCYTKFPERDIDSVISGCKEILGFYKDLFGNQDSTYLKFMISPTGSGGYGRKNYISISSNRYSPYLLQGIAHEMAHFWWNKADASTWHDWLNESFAEYSMLLFTREKFGEEAFQSFIDAYRINTLSACPIWNIDRSSPGAYSALYEKGAYILSELELRTGRERFFEFLRIILQSDIRTTEEFLNLVAMHLSVSDSEWLKIKLKS